MDRRSFLAYSAGGLAATSFAGRVLAAPLGAGDRLEPPPGTGRIKVAVAIADGATVIDFAGPWEVFQDVMVMDGGASHAEQMPFELYTVAATREPIRASAGLRIIPDFSIDEAPAPQVLVVGAQRADDRLRNWIRSASATTALTMSVCTGAYQLARAGLLDGLTATTHHDFYDDFAREFPKVTLLRDQRYVEHPRIATSGGLTSGIDLALRVVQRYFGTEVAERTAVYMEHQSTRWRNPA